MIEKNIVGVRKISEQIPVFKAEEAEENTRDPYAINELESASTNLNTIAHKQTAQTISRPAHQKPTFDKLFQNSYEKDSFSLHTQLSFVEI